MKLIKASKTLAEGMRISRGGFTKRDHLILSVGDRNINNINIEKSCDLICDVSTAVGYFDLFKKHFYRQFESIWDIKGMRSSDIEQVLLRHQTYPERSSTLVAFICCLSSIIERASLKNRSNDSVDKIIEGSYASNSYWQENNNDMLSVCDTIYNKGCSRIKHHVGVLGAKEEAIKSIELVNLCNEIDGGITHAFDLNCAYNYDDAARYIELLNTHTDNKLIFWIEEPVHFTEYNRLGDLQRGSDIPIAAGENAQNYSVLEQLMQEIKIVMPDLGRNCSPVDLRTLAEIRSSINSKISIHNYGSQCLFEKTVSAYQELENIERLEIDLSLNPLRNNNTEISDMERIIESGIKDKQLTVSAEWQLTEYGN